MACGIGVGHGTLQTLAAKHDHKPMFLDRLHKQLHAGNRDLAQRDRQRALSSDAMRPARRSVMFPALSIVQKLQRTATSPGCNSKPTPVASNAPRPMTNFSGS